MASMQIMTSSNSPAASDSPVASIMRSQSLQQVVTAVPCTVAAFPSLDSFSANSSLRSRQKTVLTPDYLPAKPRFHRGGGAVAGNAGDSNMREIGSHSVPYLSCISRQLPLYDCRFTCKAGDCEPSKNSASHWIRRQSRPHFFTEHSHHKQ